MIANFKFWIPSLLLSLLKSVYTFTFTSKSFILIVLGYVLLYLLTMSSNLSIYTFFDFEVFLINFVLYDSNNLSATTDFFHYVLLFLAMILLICYNIYCLCLPIFSFVRN